MQDLVITNKGQELMAGMVAGTTTATFTKICTSDHNYAGANLEELIELIDVKQDALVSKVSRTNPTMIEVLAAINNSDLTNGYYVRGLGLYAKDSEDNEILYGVSIESTNPDYMPAFAGKTASGISYRLITKVDNSEQVTLEIAPAAIPTIEQVEEVQLSVNTHAKKTVYGQDGMHGIRLHNGALQFYNTEIQDWIEIITVSDTAPSDVTLTSISAGPGKVTVRWSDPFDTVVDGQLLCKWKGTKLIQKVGAFPKNIKDGTVIVDNRVANTYLNPGFEINGLTNGTAYYFQLFPYSDKGAVNANATNRLMATPHPYKTMTAIIDLANSDPTTCITYADDAIGMTPGHPDWDEFFGHYPVLFKDGVEVGKLNTANFNQFEDGTAADITSGDAGDAMIAFPRRGVKITTVGNTLTISMTDDPENPDFEYLAHSRGDARKETFYLGAYKGFKDGSGKLRSLSEKKPTATQTIGTFRTQAQANGAGYENSGFYQLMFRQAMYLLKYKNLNSQVAVGRGYVDGNSAAIATGGTNAKGMDFGETTGKLQMKLFGLEDFWGNVWEWIDGIVTTSTRNMLTATTGFNDTGSGYTDQGQGATADIGGYMSKPQGSTKTGFLAKEVSGSETTYFRDYASLCASCVAHFGGNWRNASVAGAFHLYMNHAASNSAAYVAARLMYL